MGLELARPDIRQADIDEVVGVLRSGRLALGPKTVEFEEALAEYVGAKYGVAVSSGTAGLHLVLASMLSPGDEVLVPSFTFVATVNAILYIGAKPVFVDIDPETWCMSLADMRAKMTGRTKAIMGVDVFGHPCDWPFIKAFVDHRFGKIFTIDDACEALGSRELHTGKRLGAGMFADAAVFAFYPNKQITTGEGGMIVTDDQALADRCRSLRNHGRDNSGWLDHDRLGYNYRMTEMQAALGVSQLKRIDEIMAQRQQVWQWYLDCLAPAVEAGEIEVQCAFNRKINPFVFVVSLGYKVMRIGPDARVLIMNRLGDRGIPTRHYFKPVHTMPCIWKYDHVAGFLPGTLGLGDSSFALPFHTGMTEADVVFVCQALCDEIKVLFESNADNLG